MIKNILYKLWAWFRKHPTTAGTTLSFWPAWFASFIIFKKKICATKKSRNVFTIASAIVAVISYMPSIMIDKANIMIDKMNKDEEKIKSFYKDLDVTLKEMIKNAPTVSLDELEADDADKIITYTNNDLENYFNME